MKRLLRNLLIGAGRVLEMCPHQDYIYPSRDDFRRDMKALQGDWAAVTGDLQKAIDRYGKQNHPG